MSNLRKDIEEMIQTILPYEYDKDIEGKFVDAILSAIKDRLPKDKKESECGCYGESCGCEVDDYNQALNDVRKVLES